MGSSPLTRGKPSRSSGGLLFVRLIPAHAGKTQARCAAGWKQRAHPRSRGENARLLEVGLHGAGSSPLTRGKRSDEAMTRVQAGLIPAHAGKTLSSWTVTRCSGAHPRSRGENGRAVFFHAFDEGSSPLTRGKLERRSRPHAPPGLIPAHAGKTAGSTATVRIRRAHPRSRGENARSRRPHSRTMGSSPLTRGKRS